jgi:hypothetical protein
MRELKVDSPGGFWTSEEVVALWKAVHQGKEPSEPQDSSVLATSAVEQMCIVIENYLINEVLNNNDPLEAVDSIEAGVSLCSTGVFRLVRSIAGKI